MTFGQALRKAMDEQEMTQEQLGELSGVHQTTISRLLREDGSPNLRTVEALEKALPRLRALRTAA